MKKEKIIKAWAVVNKLQIFGKREQIDCFTSKNLAKEHLLGYDGQKELEIIEIKICLKQ